MKVVLTDTVFPNIEPEREILGKIADVILAPSGDEDTLIELCSTADAVVNCYAKITPKILSSLERCKVIVRTGIGVDTIPVAEASAKGIMVANVPDYCIEEVADHALALMLSLARGVDKGAKLTRSGGWALAEVKPLYRLRGKALGLLGFGRIARALASRATALGIDIIAYDPFLSADAITRAGARPVDLDGLFAESDFLSVHVPLSTATHHLVNAARLSQMKASAFVINTSRGGVIDFDALKGALVEGHLAGAGLDVLETEPPGEGAQLAQVPNLIVTPHLGFYSEEALQDLQRRSASEVLAVLEGGHPVNWFNRAAFAASNPAIS